MEKKDLRILLVGPLPPPPGGDSTWDKQYLNYSRINNYNVKIVNTSVIGKRSLNVNDRFSIYDEFKRSLFIWCNIRNLIKEYQPDIIHFNSNISPKGIIRDYISSIIIKKRKIPFIIHCHTNVGYKLKNNKISNYLLKKFFNNANKIIVLNTNSLNYSKKITMTPICIIPNFIDLYNFKGNDYKVNEKISNVIFVGHVRKEKGIDELLIAAKKFHDIQFNILGPITDDYKNYIFDSNVNAIGSVTYYEVIDHIKKNDIFIFPSYTEGFSLALLEAMAVGIPIIATDVGANKDMIEDKGGIIIPPKDYQSLIDAINELKEVNKRKYMSKWNIQKVKKYYDIDVVISELRRLYVEVINKK